MITVYALDVRGLDPENSDILCLISEARRRKARALAREKDRALSIGAELAFLALKKHLGLEGAQYAYAQNGKPFMQNSAYHIAFTHSGVLAACAVSDVLAGVDAELMRRTSALLYRAVLAPQEYARYTASDDPDRFLIETWAAKESYLKLTGEGLSKAGLQGIYLDGTEIKDMHENVRAHIYPQTVRCGADAYFLCAASHMPEKPVFIFDTAASAAAALLRRA